jgi:divalent metal cation (Fe/Co/Zn/Cd) transporter
VFIGALGSVVGIPILDPLVGLLITVAILFIVKDTIVIMYGRLMDAVDPALVDQIEKTAAQVPGVQRIEHTRLRWMGHSLLAELNAYVDDTLTTRQSHQIAEEIRHALFHEQPKLADITVHVEPAGPGDDPHSLTAHHAAKHQPQAAASDNGSALPLEPAHEAEAHQHPHP